ncbi:HAMP domain-containing histidine kinase [Pararhizobium sp. YC-54]|uniref:sensor histidine kinase n=1 Tax=Pararhizobium sp. YC-54 TaxID=2986920 RepID=UPI0021F7E68F|nr:HAMP domain-containing sensor histidine kinase [Pararhizobium sp. YC-54]MCW0001147.1 HAMP domain-containing histidine kinase [Pararhizobium sp. YC-54]
MLDLKTVLVVNLATASLQAVVWIFVWLAWRHLYELKLLAAGFTAIAIGLLLMILRGEQPAAWSIVLHNTVIKLGLVLLAEGLARFLGQPRYTSIGISLLIFQVVAWSIGLAVDPGNLAIRIHTSTLFTIIMMSVMCLALLRDRTQPWLLRWITIAVLGEYIAASIIHSAIEYWNPAAAQEITVLDNRNAWYLLQGVLFLIALFACLLFMVSSRLSAALREKNDALLREVVERRSLENQLNTSLETERALREEQVDFMRIVSHEFRTPLAVIRNATDMIGLVGDRSREATKERLSGIGEALDRLFSLIDRFMTNDRDNGFRPQSMQIGSLMADVQLHFEMTGRGERLHFRTGGEATSIFVDPDMLATVVINLIDNAFKYSPENQPIHIDTLSASGFVVIQVRDRGIGIPEAELHKIGRRFFRASNAKAGSGTGLGLYSSRKLLAYHGGTLELLSREGGGTAAVARVPMLGGATEPALQEELMT